MNKKYFLNSLFIFTLLLVISTLSFMASKRRERDVQRNLDLGAVRTALELYKGDFGAYPLSAVGKIVACADENTHPKKINEVTQFRVGATKPIMEDLVACQWGEDALLDVNDRNYPNYLTVIPKDPLTHKGYSYTYISDGEKYFLYGHFEGRSLPEYDKQIKNLGLSCGVGICNTGKTPPKTNILNPLPQN